jgi:hypothetical protein
MQRGAHFKSVVRARMVELDHHPTDKVLAGLADISENTIRSLWQGHGAEVGTLIAIANAVDMSIIDVLLAMQGRDVPPEVQPLDAIVMELRGLRETLAEAGAGPVQARGALSAIAAAQEDLAAGPAADPQDEPAAPSRRGRPDEGTLPR